MTDLTPYSRIVLEEQHDSDFERYLDSGSSMSRMLTSDEMDVVYRELK